MGVKIEAAEKLGKLAWEAGVNKLATQAMDIAASALRFRTPEAVKAPLQKLEMEIAPVDSTTNVAKIEEIWRATVTPMLKDSFDKYGSAIKTIGKIDDKPVAFAMHSPTTYNELYPKVYPSTFLQQLSVHPDFQGRGLGTQMLEGLKQTEQMHTGLMFLEVQTSNPNAMSLYFRNGFKPVGIFPFSRTDVEGVRMARELHPNAWREFLDKRYEHYLRRH